MLDFDFQSQAEKLLSTFNAHNECHTIISKEDLVKQLMEHDEFTMDGIEVALHYLHCNQKASIQKSMIEDKEITLFKFAVDWNCSVEPITPLDISIYTLNRMEKSLTKSVEAIETDIDQTDNLVRQYIRDKKKQLAKSFLRKKHVLEKNLCKYRWLIVETFILKEQKKIYVFILLQPKLRTPSQLFKHCCSK